MSVFARLTVEGVFGPSGHGPDVVRLGEFSVFIAGRTSRWSSTVSMSRTSVVASLQSKSRRTQERDRRDLEGVRCEIMCAPTEPQCETQEKDVTSGANTIQVVDISPRLIPGTKYAWQAYREAHGTIRHQ